MDSKLFMSACFIGVLLVLWHSEAAPVDSLSDREQLRRTLYRLDTVLDELIRRTEETHSTYKRNEDGSLPYKRNEDGSLPYKRNEDGPVPYRTLKRANEENNLKKVLRYLADMEDKLQKRDHVY